MKKYLAGSMATGLMMALLLAAPAFAALAKGDPAPVFKAEASLAGKDFVFSLKKALKKGPVVLYFYPSAFTRGCDLEAHTFADEKSKFEAVHATIIGVSADDIERLNAFSTDPNYCAGRFPVASDTGGKIAASYGLEMFPARAGAADVRGVEIGHGFIPRTTFVIARGGRIVATLSSDTDHLNPVEHVQESLAIVRQLSADKR